MSDDVITRAKETRKRIRNLEVDIKSNTYNRDRTDKLAKALDDFAKAEVNNNHELMIQYALQIEQSYSELAIIGYAEPSRNLLEKYDNLAYNYQLLTKKKEQVQHELSLANEKINSLEKTNKESFENNKKLVTIIDKLVEILKNLGIKLDEGFNRLAG
ncbi:MAG: hypothetical protein HY295_01040 [Thaumarchaeota archaeon]|nr:hypothetical protein [Nitrososphaerota archaeon]